MLVRVHVLAMALCLSVSLSKVGVLLKWLNESVLFLARELPWTYSTLHCITKNSGSSKNNSTSLWNFAQNSELRKFCNSILIVVICYQLSSRKVATLRARYTGLSSDVDDTWALTLDRCSLSQKSQALATARCRRASQLATADTCLEDLATCGNAERITLQFRRDTKTTLFQSSYFSP